MYAITIDLDHDALSLTQQSHASACNDIRTTLEAHGFAKQQGSVHFGDAAKVDAVACVLAVMDLSSKYAWFSTSVKDVRMLRIDEISDLMPAVQKGATEM